MLLVQQVHGVVANLVRVKDPETSTALEVAAGGKLFQVRKCGGFTTRHASPFSPLPGASTGDHAVPCLLSKASIS